MNTIISREKEGWFHSHLTITETKKEHMIGNVWRKIGKKSSVNYVRKGTLKHWEGAMKKYPTANFRLLKGVNCVRLGFPKLMDAVLNIPPLSSNKSRKKNKSSAHSSTSTASDLKVSFVLNVPIDFT